MTDLKSGQVDGSGNKTEESDGRRQRSERSRAQIIDALFALIREGDVSPSAAKVAERAGVGLRTVFRHFEDMDSLYVEMAERISAEIMPLVNTPFSSTDWRERLREHCGRRIEIYERIFPVRVSANIRRFGSQFLMEEYRRNLAMEQELLKVHLPDEILSDPIRFAAIDTALGFQTWRRLRQDLQMPVEEASAVVRLTLDRLIAP
ncbi:TetR/AcrR family transcriptional regulator [Hyphomonas sp.]|uniref:TetR/AcrR family transcriptional regulator n=1 Tax=Hyphomonas sp. TaxID=87 RepID=UPI00391BB9A0